MQAAQQKRPVRSAGPSIISADLVVNGTLTSTGDIQVDGRVEGDVRSAGLVIGDKAVIHGEVFAEEVTIRGRVEGGVRARKVLLCSTCHVQGNILHEAFAVETGAFFEGNCRHSDNPLSEDFPPMRQAEYARPAPAPAPAMNTTAPLNTPAAAPTLAAVARPLDANGAARPVSPAAAPMKT
jgi:cytoskeletal protein CcmA (bactofilin family)